jgi:hypothetical protein
MRYAWRSLLVLAVFLGVGYAVMHLVIAHSVQRSTPLPELRLAGAMAGLFAGGAAACVVGIALVWRRPPQEE